MNDLIIAAFERLKREGKVKKQQDLVDKLGIHKSTVSEVLRGKKLANESFVKKFEEVFGRIKQDESMIEPNGSGEKEIRYESYQVRLHEDKSGKIILPANITKEDVQLVIEFLKLMLKSMQ